MSELEEAIKRLTSIVLSSRDVDALRFLVAELERSQAAASEIAVGDVRTVAKLGLAEQRITELEADNAKIKQDSRYLSFAVLQQAFEDATDDCPQSQCTEGTYRKMTFGVWRYSDCMTCGGLGRVAKAQPETRRVQIDSSPLPDGYTMAHVMDESRCVLAEWIDDEEQDGELWLTMLAGSGSWESEQ